MVISSAAVRFARRKRAASFSEGNGTSTLKSIEAPWEGLNTRDTFDNLGETEARKLVNWFPGPGGLTVRKGYTSWATGIGSGDVRTLAHLNTGAVSKFIAFSDVAAFDITAGGAGVSLKSGLTASGRWDHDQMEGTIAFVDGINTPQQYDGTTWADLVLTGDIVGLTPIGVKVFKNRAYYWVDDTQDIYYTEDKAIGGIATKFRLGAVVHAGGKLVQVEAWSVDGGDGKDDLIVFMFSSGLMAVYTGLNPADATWDLVGVFKYGIPLGRDTSVDFGGDLITQTREDYLRLTPLTLQQGQEARSLSRMSGAITQAARMGSALDGWTVSAFPNGNMIIFNVPITTTVFAQHVLNTSINAWTTFTDIPARVWGEFDGGIYFGDGAGNVWKFWDTNADNGAGIAYDAETSWNSLGSPNTKTFRGVRPVLTATGTLNFGVGMAFDFGSVFAQQQVSQASVGTPWGSPWGSAWSPTIQPKRDMFGAEGVGVTTSLRISGTALNQQVTWYRTDYMYVIGGFI